MKNFTIPQRKLVTLRVIFIFSFLFSCFFVGRTQTHTPITTNISDHIKGYWEYLPADYKTSTKKYPLLIFLHGIGESGNGTTSDLQKVLRNGPPRVINDKKFPNSFTVNGQTSSFIVISPQIKDNARSVPELDALINYVKAKYRVDANRIYLSGVSNGGGTSWYYGVYGGKTLAALMVVCGNLPANDNYVDNLAKLNIPVWATHNSNDPTVSSKNTVDWVNKLNAYVPAINPKALINIFNSSAHDAWTQTYDPNWRPNGKNVYEWMLQYSKGGKVETPANTPPTAIINGTTNLTLPHNSTILDGSGSKAEGTIKSYSWKIISGSTHTLENASSAKATVKNLIAGNYTFHLTVTDDKGATGTASINLTVNKAIENSLPSAIIKAPASITLPTSSIVLDGSSSTSNGSTIKSYQWEFASGVGGYSSEGTRTSKLTVKNLVTPGTRTFKLTVTDHKGATNSALVSFTVNKANSTPVVSETPVAVIDAPASITLPTSSIVLDGSSSTSKSGSIKSYVWEFDSGIGGYVLEGTRTSKLIVKNLSTPGTRTFKLTVTDSKGANATKKVTFAVNKASGLQSLAKPASDINAISDVQSTLPQAIINAPASITLPTSSIVLDGSASVSNGGSIKSYEWKFVSGTGGYALAGTRTSKLTVGNLTTAGTRTFQLTVTNDKGATGTAQVTFTVNKAGEASAIPTAPEVIITAPASITLPTSSILLDGSASVSKGRTIKSYSWKFASGTGGYSLSGTATSKLTVLNLSTPGTRTFQLTITDDKGATGTGLVSFTVNKATEQVATPPVAIIKGHSDLQLPANSLVLDGSSSTSTGGSIKSYAWSYVSGPSNHSLSGATSSKATINNLVEGNYSFKLVVTNDKGLTGSATASFKVSKATELPTPPPSGDCGCNVTLTAGSDGGIYADNKTLGAKPGDVICIKAGTYKSIQLYNFNGTAAKPFIFKNCGGRVIFSGNDKNIYMIGNSFFKFTGTGSSDKYGFKVTTTTSSIPNSSIGMKVSNLSTDFEIDHLEIEKVSLGFLIKTDPGCDPSTWQENFTMRNVSLHDNYVHDIGLEGFYVGYTHASTTVNCNGTNKTVYPQLIKGLKIYNNVVENTGWDGIQVGHAPEGVEAYNNTITNYGTKMESGQQSGFQFNPGSNGNIYNNTVMTGGGPGIMIMGQGKHHVYNNLIVDAGDDKNSNSKGNSAIFVDDRPPVEGPKITVFIANNTIVNPKRYGVNLLNSYGNVGTDNTIVNNLFVMSGIQNYDMGKAIAAFNNVPYTATNNIDVKTIAEAKFVDAARRNYQLTAASPAVGAGKNLSVYNIPGFKLDLLGKTRTKYDAGAYEFGATSFAPQSNPNAIAMAMTANDANNLSISGKVNGLAPNASNAVTSNKFKQGLVISPVPAKDQLNVYLNDVAIGKAIIRVTDMSGRVVILKDNFNKDGAILQDKINVSSLPAGMYFFEILVGGKEYIGKSKFLKID